MALPKVVAIVQLAGEIELYTDGDDASDSEIYKEGADIFQEDSIPHEEVLLLGLETQREHQNRDPNYLSF